MQSYFNSIQINDNMPDFHSEKSKDAVNQKLEFLILKKYALVEDIQSEDFRRSFEDEYYPFEYEDAKKVLQYLHTSGYLESAPGKFTTLRITEAGKQKYKLESAALGRRNLFPTAKKYTTYAEKEQFALNYILRLFPHFP